MARATKETRQRAPPEAGGRLGRDSAVAWAGDLFSAAKFSNGPWERFGDVFPLPLPRDLGYAGDVHSLRSRRSRQRVHKRRTLVDRERGSVWALNTLAGFPDEAGWPSHCLNRAQESVIERVKRAHRTRPPPLDDASPQAALRQLLMKKAGSAYGVDQPGQLVSYSREKLSIPRDQLTPVNLESILPEREREQLADFESHMLLDDESIALVLERGFQGDCHLDPVLAHDPQKYHELIGDLYQARLISFTMKPKVQVGLFCVAKKGGRQRLIVDARRSNKLFAPPPSTVLGSVDAWARLEVGGESEVFLAQEDIKDCFYRLGISQRLGEYFCLPEVDPELLRQAIGFMPEELQRVLDEDSGPVYPFFQVLPMGFSWAFHLAHQAHQEIARTTLPGVPFARDRRAAPRLGRQAGEQSRALLVYADNANHLGVKRDEVGEDQRRLIEALHGHGLSTHDVMEPAQLGESLGVRIDGFSGKVGPTAKRDWNLDRALMACSSRPAISGEELQVIIGHMTVRSLLHRGVMGILRHAYSFVESSYCRRQRLWPSVVQELELFRNLMPLAVGSLRSCWASEVLATDACPSGYAVCRTEAGPAEVAAVGREDERWRFHRGGPERAPPRAAALDTALVFEDPLTVKPDEVAGEVLIENPDFVEVPRSLLHPDRWRLLWNAPFGGKEPIHVLECRSILSAVKHMCRDSRRHGQRVLVLNDNMGVCLAVQKGRASDFSLLRLIRRISAHCLACGLRLHVRWVASEHNVADKGSRAWEGHKGERSQNGNSSKESQEGRCGLLEGGGREGKPEDGNVAWRHFRRDREVGWEEEMPKSIAEARATSKSAEASRFDEHVESQSEKEGSSMGATEKVCKASEGYRGRVLDPGAGEREGINSAGLREQASRFLRLRDIPSAGDKGRVPARRGAVRLRRQPVLGWRKLQLWPEAPRCLRVSAARRSQGGEASPSPVPPVSQGVEAHGSHTNTFAAPRVHEVLDLGGDDRCWSEGDGALQRGIVQHVRSAGRVASHEGGGFRLPQQRVQSLRPGTFALREGRGEQDGCLRRGPHLGRREGALVGEPDEVPCGCPFKGRRGGGHVELQGVGLSSDMEDGRGSAGDPGDRPQPLSESPWGSKSRSLDAVEEHRRHTEAGSMGCGCECEDLRQAREAPTGPEQVRESLAAVWGDGEGRLSPLVPQWIQSAAGASAGTDEQTAEGRAMLSLFGGAAEPAKAWARRGGHAAVIDVAGDPANDLSKPARWNILARHLHRFSLLGIDLPCNTWSRARRGPPGSCFPQPLRGDDAHTILGLPDLSEKDAATVKAANRMVIGACKLIRRALRLGIPGYLENPMCSRLWLCPMIRKLLQDTRVTVVKVDMCQYGTQWMRPTKLMVWNVNKFDMLRCRSRGVCDRTSKAHLVLTGISGKRFLTEHAQVYPKAFGEALVQSLWRNAHMQQSWSDICPGNLDGPLSSRCRRSMTTD